MKVCRVSTWNLDVASFPTYHDAQKDSALFNPFQAQATVISPTVSVVTIALSW